MSSAVASVAAAAVAKRRAGRVTRNSHDGLSALVIPPSADDSDDGASRIMRMQPCVPVFDWMMLLQASGGGRVREAAGRPTSEQRRSSRVGWCR